MNKMEFAKGVYYSIYYNNDTETYEIVCLHKQANFRSLNEAMQFIIDTFDNWLKESTIENLE